MTEDHPNIVLLSKLDIRDLDTSQSLFSDQFVWHYFNPNLPDLEGNYLGADGMRQPLCAILCTNGGSQP